MQEEFVFTSESVSEGHPDKVCDRISDEVVDAFFRYSMEAGWDPRDVRVACETMATTNRIVIAGETRGSNTIGTFCVLTLRGLRRRTARSPAWRPTSAGSSRSSAKTAEENS